MTDTNAQVFISSLTPKFANDNSPTISSTSAVEISSLKNNGRALVSNELKNNFLIYYLSIYNGYDNDYKMNFLVIFPDGYYNIDELNAMFKRYMHFNGHYYIDENNETMYFFRIIYDAVNDKLTIQIESQTFIGLYFPNIDDSPGIYITEPFAELIGFNKNQPNSTNVFTKCIGFVKTNICVYDNVNQIYNITNSAFDGPEQQKFVIVNDTEEQKTHKIYNYFNNVKLYHNIN